MDAEQSWQLIAAERRSLADLLSGLSPADWATPSLCAGWRVRDVAAHVALAPQPPKPRAMLSAAVRAGGRFHRLNHDLAVAYAEQTEPAELVATLRRLADCRDLPVVTSYRNIVFDILVHGQDIAVPLGIDRPMPLQAARSGAQRVWAMGWPFWARRRLTGLRLTAEDCDFDVGRGAVVRGPVSSLLLLLTGRTRAALPHLHGPGTAQLHASAGIPDPATKEEPST